MTVFHSDAEMFRPIPETHLKISNFYRIRHADSHQWFGRVVFHADPKSDSVGLKAVVLKTDSPSILFEYREPAKGAKDA